MSATDTLLQQGIAAARTGDRTAARVLLTHLVEDDERNEQGWLWLAGVTDEPENIRVCLENVLELNPANVHARQGLAWLEQRYGPEVASAAPARPAGGPIHPISAPAVAAVAGVTGVVTLPPASPPAEAASKKPKKQAAPKKEAAPKPPPRPRYPTHEEVVARGPDIGETAAACPYCGEMNELKRTWCSRCEHSLMIRGPIREQRSAWVSIVSIFWKIGGVLGILGTLAILVLALIGYSSLKSAAGPDGDVPFPFDSLAAVVVSGMLAAGQIKVAVSLWERQRWAYIVVLVITALQVIGAVVNTLIGSAILSAAFADMDMSQYPADAEQAIQIVMGLINMLLLGMVVIQGLFLLLVLLGWRDFFGPMVRFLPEVKGASDADLFNNGLACKARKMWFMAMRQWEAAASKAGRDPEYLHALGLAYAQLGWLTRARETLDKAISVEPKSEALRQSRARLDQIGQPQAAAG